MNTSTPMLHTQESVMGNIIDGLPAKGFNSMSGAKQFSICDAFGCACEELATARNEAVRLGGVNAAAMAQLKLAIEDYDKTLAENSRLLSRVAELEGALEQAKRHNDRACRILGTLRTETRPISGHTDPGAIEDCWREAFDELLQQDEVFESARQALAQSEDRK